MSRFMQLTSAMLLCCAMAFPVAAQRKGDQGNKGGGKETRDIQREPKGDRGGGRQERPRGDSGNHGNNGGDRGNNGGGGGKHGYRPN
jgi:hypothetical protein